MKDNEFKLCLGTVQFGLNYGINNPNGKPSKEKALEMLDYAYENGIRHFDTAAAYGDAEEILGEFIKKNNLENKIFIASKFKPDLSGNKKNIGEAVENGLKKTLGRLNIKKLYGYYLHEPEYIYNNEILNALRACKSKGLAENIGVSIFEEKDAVYAAQLSVDIIQIPYSVFDQRLNKTDFFEIVKKNKITVFARSAFLQGLIFMDEGKIPEYLAGAKFYLEKFDGIIKKYGFSRLEAALLFSYQNKNIDYVVFGAENIDFLKENIKIAERNTEFNACMKELENGFSDIDRKIITPGLWKKN